MAKANVCVLLLVGLAVVTNATSPDVGRKFLSGETECDAKHKVEANDQPTIWYRIGISPESESGELGTFFATNRKSEGADEDSPHVFTVGKGEVIPGVDKSMLGLCKDSKWEFTIPPQLAYGDVGIEGAIPPGATLTYIVEVIELKKAGGFSTMGNRWRTLTRSGDLDRDKKISLDEFIYVMENANKSTDPYIFRVLDVDSNGYLTETEYIQHSIPQRREMGQMFRDIDEDKSGGITIPELEKFYGYFSPLDGNFKVESHKEADTNGDGAVTVPELKMFTMLSEDGQYFKMFKAVDIDKDGIVTLAEIAAVELSGIVGESDKGQLSSTFTAWDGNKDGNITREEVRAFIKEAGASEELEDKTRSAYSFMDKNGDLLVDRKEFLRSVAESKPKTGVDGVDIDVNQDEALKDFNSWDTDGDKLVTYEEFAKNAKDNIFNYDTRKRTKAADFLEKLTKEGTSKEKGSWLDKRKEQRKKEREERKEERKEARKTRKAFEDWGTKKDSIESENDSVFNAAPYIILKELQNAMAYLRSAEFAERAPGIVQFFIASLMTLIVPYYLIEKK